MNVQTSDPRKSHSVQDFIAVANSVSDFFGYADTSYMEKRDGIEYIVKNVIDNYLDELNTFARTIKLTDTQVMEYRYNPKKLSNKLYNTTRLWYIILKINGLASVHDFDLSSHKIKLIPAQEMRTFMSKVYNNEKNPILIYNSAHKNDTDIVIEEKYVPDSNESKRYLYM